MPVVLSCWGEVGAVGHHLPLAGSSSALGPHRAGDAGCAPQACLGVCGVDVSPLLVSLGAVAMHSVSCSSASVFYNTELVIELWLASACV